MSYCSGGGFRIRLALHIAELVGTSWVDQVADSGTLSMSAPAPIYLSVDGKHESVYLVICCKHVFNLKHPD